jgi:hypothetical protein
MRSNVQEEYYVATIFRTVLFYFEEGDRRILRNIGTNAPN